MQLITLILHVLTMYTIIPRPVHTRTCTHPCTHTHVQSLKPGIKMIAAEPKKADDCARSFAAGERLSNPTYPDTVADGLRLAPSTPTMQHSHYTGWYQCLCISRSGVKYGPDWTATCS